MSRENSSMWSSARHRPIPAHPAAMAVLAAMLLMAAALGGCGYSLESRQPTVIGDSGKRVKLRKVEQPTLYEWLGQSIRNEMRDEINARKVATWVDGDDCDFIMDIKVGSFTLRSWLRDASDDTVMYEGRLQMEAFLYRAEDNAEVWRSGMLAYSETFDADTPEAAASKLSKRLAQQIVNKMRHTF